MEGARRLFAMTRGFFFFSSRRRHTRCSRDWSSDVCSSDLEAMAIGLPTVAFDCPSGPRELADGGDAAIIVKPGDVDMLAEALCDLAGDREFRRQLGARAAAFVRREFSEASVMADWDSLISDVIRRRKSGARSRIG